MPPAVWHVLLRALRRGVPSSAITYRSQVDFLCDDCHAIALLGQTRSPHRDQISLVPSNDRFRLAVGPLQMMNDANDVSLGDLASQFKLDFKDTRLRCEQIIFTVQGLR